MANERQLIDAERLKRRIIAFATGLHADYLAIENIVMMINQEYTLDFVYCKDCKHYAMWADGRTMNHCDKHDRTAYDDNFCSYGERKSGTQPQREDV